MNLETLFQTEFPTIAFHKSFPPHAPYMNATLPNLIPSCSGCQQQLHSSCKDTLLYMKTDLQMPQFCLLIAICGEIVTTDCGWNSTSAEIRAPNPQQCLAWHFLMLPFWNLHRPHCNMLCYQPSDKVSAAKLWLSCQVMLSMSKT